MQITMGGKIARLAKCGCTVNSYKDIVVYRVV